MHRRLHDVRILRIRFIAAATLCAFLLASVGYPLWSAGDSKDFSQPFPCMYRQCGCRNADQCLRGCCCFTNREKLAWAKEHDVVVPQFVVAAAEAEQPAKRLAAACCTLKAKSCCEAKSSTAKKSSAKNSTPIVRDGFHYVVSVIEALHCQGHVDQWVAIGAIDVVPPQLWQLDLPLSGTLAIFSEARESLAFAPQPPPPWC